ncbi:hypothetical protein VE02_02941 [Pseudogymnoascus sp. 03VT05]|nr:hypothetical protein VE02_02941 [Pseudogymnoascus sp. 03VT05]
MPGRGRGRERGDRGSSNIGNSSISPNLGNAFDASNASSHLGHNPLPRPSYRTGLVDPDFDPARIGPDLGPVLEAQLQAGRAAGKAQIKQNYREAQLLYGGEELVQQDYDRQSLVQRPYAGQWGTQQSYVGEELVQQPYAGQSQAQLPYVGESVANPAAYDSVQDRLGYPVTDPDPAAAAAVTTGAVSASNPGPSRPSATTPPFQNHQKVAPEVVVSLQNLAAGQGGISNMAPPPQKMVPEVGARLQDLSAGQSGMFNTAPIPTPQGVDLNLVAQLPDLVYQPGGIPDILPPGLTQMPGLDPRFLPGPDGRYPDLPPPPSEPQPDLETRLRNMLAQFDADIAAQAAGPAEPVVPASPKKLVVVCCLATWIGTRDTEDKWVAMPAQGTRKGWGLDMANPPERECWKKQIWKGLEVLKEMNGEGVLMFSGGPWYDKSQISAAKSYLDLARVSNYWGYLKGNKYKDYHTRIITEDRAMDSLQNVMFSLIEFNIRYKNFPEEMTVISYEHKLQRFENVHFKTAKEILLPTAQADIDVSWQGIPTFIGIDPRDLWEYPRSEKAIAICELETQTRDLWKASPYGLSEELMVRKETRNRWRIDLYYQLVFARGAELVAALERNAKAAPPIEEVMDMSVN